MSGRYAQCDDTCTVDCGHCKGAGRPADDWPREVVHSHGIVAFCGTDAVCRCDFRWRSVADYETHLADVLRAYADQQSAEDLGEALGIGATRGPLEAVAWMARRHAALRQQVSR